MLRVAYCSFNELKLKYKVIISFFFLFVRKKLFFTSQIMIYQHSSNISKSKRRRIRILYMDANLKIILPLYLQSFSHIQSILIFPFPIHVIWGSGLNNTPNFPPVYTYLSSTHQPLFFTYWNL